MPPDTYYVDIADDTDNTTNSLPAGLTQTMPTANTASSDLQNQSHGTPIPNTTLTGYPINLGSGQENLIADFSYTKPLRNSIGDTLWRDADTSGTSTPDLGEPPLAGVTMLLRDGDDKIIATTTTNSQGQYLFTDLPDGTYTV